MIKNILYVEDGSVDLDELESTLTTETKIIVYRQGSTLPRLVQLQVPINDTFSEEEFKTQEKLTVKEFAEKIDLYLIKLFHQAHDSQKECEQHNGTVWENGWQRNDERMIMIQNDIQPFIRQLAEQYGKEEK